MSRSLLLYLVASLAIAIVWGLSCYGGSGWYVGLMPWLATSLLAWLLYGEQRGHPIVLLVPASGLIVMLWLQTLARQ